MGLVKYLFLVQSIKEVEINLEAFSINLQNLILNIDR